MNETYHLGDAPCMIHCGHACSNDPVVWADSSSPWMAEPGKQPRGNGRKKTQEKKRAEQSKNEWILVMELEAGRKKKERG